MNGFFENIWLVLLLVAVCVAAAVFALGKGFDAGIDDGAQSQSQRLIDKPVPAGEIDTGMGAYRGVGLTDSDAVVREAMGEPQERNQDAYTPTVVGFHDPWIGPYSANCGDRGPHTKMAYRDAMFILSDRQVCAIIVAGGGWTTTEGVAAGDPISDFEDRNPRANCFDQSLSEYNLQEQRDCRLRLENGLLLWVGGDPINGVAIANGRLRR